MATFVVAVGVPLGAFFDPDGNAEEPSYSIRSGDEYVRMDATDYRAWMGAFADQNRDQLVRSLEADGIDNAADVIESMIGDHLLVELEPGAERSRDALKGHRLVPLGVGLGNSREEPFDFGIGTISLEAAVSVDYRMYTVWTESFRQRSMWDVCSQVSEQLEVPIVDLVDQLVDSLPALVAGGAAYVDPL